MTVEGRQVERDGEVGSFEVFYRLCYRRTLAVVLVLRGPRAAAEESVQEAFLRAYVRWDEVREMDRPDLWVQRVAINLGVSYLRRAGAEARALTRLGSQPQQPATDEFAAAERFWQLARRLPRGHAQVVALHYAGDLPVADIAAVLEIPSGTVKSRLHTARAHLAQLLESEEGVHVADIELEARRACEAARREADTRPAPPPIGELVSGLADGEVIVLDATSPHQDIKLVAHCTRNGGFEDVGTGRGSPPTGGGSAALPPAGWPSTRTCAPEATMCVSLDRPRPDRAATANVSRRPSIQVRSASTPRPAITPRTPSTTSPVSHRRPRS